MHVDHHLDPILSSTQRPAPYTPRAQPLPGSSLRHGIGFLSAVNRRMVQSLIPARHVTKGGHLRVDTDHHTAKTILRSIRRHDRLAMIVIIGVLVIVIAVMILIPQLARSAPSEPGKVTMTSEAGKKILAEAKNQGWECYRSKLHDDWGDAHRCFKANDRGDQEAAQAVMTLLFQGRAGKEPVLTSAGVEVIGSQTRGVSVDDAISIMSKSLGGDIERFFHRTDTMDATTMPGDVLVVAAPPSLQVVDTSGNMLARQQNASAAALPEKNAIVPGLEDHGFDCNFDYKIVCSKHIGNAGQALISMGENQVQVTVEPSSTQKKAERKRAKIAKILADVELTDTDGVDFLSSSPETGQRADFGDYSMHVLLGIEDNTSRFVFTISSLYDGNLVSLGSNGRQN